VLAIRRADGNMELSPLPDAKVGGGDFLIVMGQREGLRKLERLFEVRP
jgi:K+/H+ antiporter YhaU regulatory subunit KhtT